MSESDGGNPIQVAVVVLLLVGGGWYFFRNYEIDGLDELSVYPKNSLAEDETYIAYREPPAILGPISCVRRPTLSEPNRTENPFAVTRTSSSRPRSETAANEARTYRNLKVASWALDAFGPTKLSNSLARQNVARVVRQLRRGGNSANRIDRT